MNDRLSDDAFAARLREVTADVPSSRLDLDAVFTSSRRKAVRHRAGVGALCVAAVAVAGIGAPQVAALLPNGRASAALVVGASTGDGATAPASCDPADVEVTWRSERVQPVVAWAERTIYDGESTVTDELVPFDPQQSAPSVSHGISPEMEAGIFREAAETEGSGFKFPEWSLITLETNDGPPRQPDALVGFSGADEAPLDWHGFDTMDEPAPDTYLYFKAADEHVASGHARCGDTSAPFTLSYWTSYESGKIACAYPVDEYPLGVYLKLAYCEVPLSGAERAAVGLESDDPRSLAAVDATMRVLKIGPRATDE